MNKARRYPEFVAVTIIVLAISSTGMFYAIVGTGGLLLFVVSTIGLICYPILTIRLQMNPALSQGLFVPLPGLAFMWSNVAAYFGDYSSYLGRGGFGALGHLMLSFAWFTSVGVIVPWFVRRNEITPVLSALVFATSLLLGVGGIYGSRLAADRFSGAPYLGIQVNPGMPLNIRNNAPPEKMLETRRSLKPDQLVLTVGFVAEGSPAARANMQMLDVITAINGQAVQHVSDIEAILNATPPDTMLDFEVERGNGLRMSVPVRVGRKYRKEPFL